MKIKKFKANKIGRDFIIGDLHGCYDKLMDKLNHVNFDETKDRLFSVGDLIDRGPDSFKCAELIYEPWFHAVQGNHERMAFNTWLGTYSMFHSSYDFFRNGGAWTHDVEKGDLKVLLEDMYRIMYHVIFVENRTEGFAIAHSKISQGYGGYKMSNIDVDNFVWDRSIYDDMRNVDPKIMHSCKDANGQNIILSPYDPSKRLIYVGHNTLANNNTILINNHMMLDTGAYKEDGTLTMVEHTKVLERLNNG